MKNRKFCARYGYMGMGEGVGRGSCPPVLCRFAPTIIVRNGRALHLCPALL